jgi:hypothetical protein
MCHPERSEGSLQLFAVRESWETAEILRFAHDDRRLIVSQLLRERVVFPAARVVLAVIGIYACGLSSVSCKSTQREATPFGFFPY